MREATSIDSVEQMTTAPVTGADNTHVSSQRHQQEHGHHGGQRTYHRTIATHARTSFSFASRFLPRRARESTVVLYAFFRTLDDLVDEAEGQAEREAAREEVGAWRRWLEDPGSTPAPREPLGNDLLRTIDRHGIPGVPFEHFLCGLEFDLNNGEIVNMHDLERYCYQVASTVGIAMSHTLGAKHDAAIAAASRLSAAMQLTNILRDVGEDLAAGRIYLPSETLEKYGLGRSALEKMAGTSGPTAAYRRMIADHIEIARSWYCEGLAGVWELPDECRFPILVAGRLYRQLLTNIEAADYDTLRVRVKTSRIDKLRQAVGSYVQLRTRRTAPEIRSVRIPE